jgi:invasion protein IalB
MDVHTGAGHLSKLFRAAFILLTMTSVAQAQQPKAKGPPPVAQSAPPAAAAEAAAANAPAQPGWTSRCTSANRTVPLECAIEQTAVLTKTGQLIVLVAIRVPGDTRAPTAVLLLPLGLNLPGGAKMQVDDGKAVDLAVQTCEQRGCFASTPVAPDLLAAMKSGKQLNVSFQTQAKETVTIPMPLADFAAAYEKIK